MKRIILSIFQLIFIFIPMMTSVSANTVKYYANWTIPQGGNPGESFESTPRNSVTLSNTGKLHKTAAITATNSGIGGTIFVGSYVYQLRQSAVVKIDLSNRNKLVWTATIGNTGADSLLYYAGKVYVANNRNYALYVLDANSGHAIKVLNIGSDIWQLAANSGRIVVVNDGTIRLYNTTSFAQIGGTFKSMITSFGFGLVISSTTLYVLDTQYDSHGTFVNNIIHIVNVTTGKQTSQFFVNDTGSVGLTLYNNLLVVTEDTGKIMGYSATGKLLWTNNTHRQLGISPAVENGRLFFLSNTGRLIAIDAATGKNIFNIATNGSPTTVTLSNSVIYTSSGLTVNMFSAANGKPINNQLTVASKVKDDSIMEVVPLGNNTIASVSVGLEQITLFSV